MTQGRAPTDEQIVEAMLKSCCVVVEAAKLLKVNRSSLSRRINSHPKLKTACLGAFEEVLDGAESELHKAIKAGNLRAVIFLLETRGKHRGYARRNELTGEDGGPIVTEGAADRVASRLTAIESRMAGMSSEGTG